VAAGSSLGWSLCVVRGTGLSFAIGHHQAMGYGGLSAGGLAHYRSVSSSDSSAEGRVRGGKVEPEGEGWVIGVETRREATGKECSFFDGRRPRGAVWFWLCGQSEISMAKATIIFFFCELLHGEPSRTAAHRMDTSIIEKAVGDEREGVSMAQSCWGGNALNMERWVPRWYLGLQHRITIHPFARTKCKPHPLLPPR